MLVLNALFHDTVHQRFVELILVWVVKALSQDGIHQRLVVLFITTSSRRTRRSGWRRMKCSMSLCSFRSRRICGHHTAGGCER